MNHLQRGLMVGLLSASVCGTTWAATIIERQEMGKTQKVTLDRQQVRIDSSDPNFYILMDLNQGMSYMVNGKEKRIVKIKIIGTPPPIPPQDGQPWGRRSQSRYAYNNQPVKAKLIKVGNGPAIAGYPTVTYQIKANNKVCSENYFSKPATNVPYIMDFLNAISKMSSSRKVKGVALPACIQAYNDLEAEYMKLGVPMKTVIKGKKGNLVMYEITRIQTNVDVPSRLFRLPNYKMISEQQMIQEGLAEMKKLRQKAEQAGGESHRYNRRPPQDYNRPPQDYRRGGDYNYNRPPQDYNRPPQDYRRGRDYNYNRPPQNYNRPPQDYRRGGDYNRPPQDYNSPPPYDPSMMPPR